MNKLLFFLLFYCSYVHTQSLPTIEEVAKHYFSSYYYKDPVLIAFEKQPDGYYVKQISYNAKEAATNRCLFYSLAQKDYLLLDNHTPYNKDTLFNNARKTQWSLLAEPINGALNTATYLKQLHPSQLDAYHHQAYYGYPTWYLDAIAFFEKQNQLNHDQLYYKGEAYVQAAMSLLSVHHHIYNDADRAFQLKAGQNSLSAQQVDSFLLYHHQAIKAFEELHQRAPKYTTRLGDIKLKLANEIMHAFVTLLYYQNEEHAKNVLKTDIYDEYYLIEARNTLASCPKDAVLFTSSTTESYPLYYIQATEGFRTDVIIADLSLSSLARYRSMLIKGPLGAKTLNTQLSDRYYSDDFILWASDDKKEAFHIQDIYPLLNQTQFYYPYGTPLFTASSNKCIVDVPKGTIIYKVSDDSNTTTFTNPTSFYMPKEIFQLDLLQSNGWERPICFSLATKADNYKCFAQHLVVEGNIYRLYPYALEQKADFYATTGEVNIDFGLDYWLHMAKYNEQALDELNGQLPFYQKNILALHQLADQLYTTNRHEEALSIIHQLMHKFPNNIKAWDENWYRIIDLLDRENEIALAKTIAQQLLINIKEGQVAEAKSTSLKENLCAFVFRHGLEDIMFLCD